MWILSGGIGLGAVVFLPAWKGVLTGPGSLMVLLLTVHFGVKNERLGACFPPDTFRMESEFLSLIEVKNREPSPL